MDWLLALEGAAIFGLLIASLRLGWTAGHKLETALFVLSMLPLAVVVCLGP